MKKQTRNILIIVGIVILIIGIYVAKTVVTKNKNAKKLLEAEINNQNEIENVEENNTIQNEIIVNNIDLNETQTNTGKIASNSTSKTETKQQTTNKEESTAQPSQEIQKEQQTQTQTQTQTQAQQPEVVKQKYILYDFGYDGCYYCQVMEPIFEKYKNSYSNITFKQIDIYENTDLTNTYKIQYTPTFIMVKQGSGEVERKVGAMSEETFKAFVEKYK